ncbi:MAG TPA: fibronectin type III domain-containing protein [Polyangiaceae bacterium]|jgi:hypothetical protein|nr:fibronectin type III domain-containing protein [Polyangiaceae bacterium]
MWGFVRATLLLSPLALGLGLACSGKAVIEAGTAGAGGASSAGRPGVASAGTGNSADVAGSGAKAGAGGSGEPMSGGAGNGGAGGSGGPILSGAGKGGATTAPTDVRPPTFDGIESVEVGATQATLTWQAATDDVTPQIELEYVVYLSLTPFSSDSNLPLGEPFAISDPGATSIAVYGLTSQTQYYFLVRARDLAFNEDVNTKQLGAITLVSFEADVQPIFTTNCVKSGCHSSNAPMKMLDLSDGISYANIIEVPSRYQTQMSPKWGCKQLNRVEPFDLADSFLMLKLNHDSGLNATSGCTCPTCPNVIDPSVADPGWNFGEGEPHDLCRTDPSCPGLPEGVIEVISDWIAQGALDN